jgi:preprotein translocase subunit SecA
MSILKGIFGSENDRIIKKWQPLLDKINALEAD